MELLYEFELEYDEKSPFGKDPKADLEFLLDAIRATDPTIDTDLIERSFNFCVDKHSDVSRKSGIPYYTHPLNVALILLKEFTIHDSPSLAACLLHDTIEDVEQVNKDLIAAEFSHEISDIVDAVTKIDAPQIDNGELEFMTKAQLKQKIKAFTYRKIFLALVRDIRVILIKLADRLHNMRTLHYMKPEKQADIALETLNFYVPLAHRLGLNMVKMELENRSFYYSDRAAYEGIREALNSKRRDFIDYIRMFADHIQNSLNDNNLPHQLSVVHKHEYEIYKMIQEGVPLSEIDNFYSMVIILKSSDVHECYRAHGVLANAFNAISFVDYIANPKLDWYKALNTELFGPDGKKVEILIRTEEMEKISEEGFAANFSLRSGRIRALEFEEKDIENWGEWMQDVIEENEDSASHLIWDSIKVNLFDSELVVYSKHGKAYKMPEGATLIDFAFALNVDSGLNCLSGKVNGAIKDISYKLRNGDQIDIIASTHPMLKPEWKEFAITQKAVYYLHSYFKNHVPEKPKKEPKPTEKIISKLIIKGDDKEGMLQEITNAVGSANIRRVSLDTSGPFFEGIITIDVQSADELNHIFSRLLMVKGIRGVERVDE